VVEEEVMLKKVTEEEIGVHLLMIWPFKFKMELMQLHFKKVREPLIKEENMLLKNTINIMKMLKKVLKQKN